MSHREIAVVQMIKSRSEASISWGSGVSMNTFLSDEDVSFQNECRQFVKETLAPLLNSVESDQTVLKDILQKIAQAGYLAASMPKQYGGKGGQFLHSALLAEELGRCDAGIATVVATHLAVAELVNRFGTDTQKSRYLPLLARGEVLATIAYLEDDQQVLPQDVETKIAKDGNKLFLEGSKRFVVNAAGSALFLVLAQDSDTQRFWLFDNLADKSLKVEPEESWFGLTSANPGKVTFGKVEIEEKNRIEAQGTTDIPTQFDFALDVVRILLAAACVGMVEGELALAAQFTRTAQRSGEPLADSQAIQWKLADEATECSASRLLTYRAAWSKEGEPTEFTKNASMCKFFASKVARTYSGETLQILGISHSGAAKNFARLYRDAKMIELIAGSSEEQKALISRELKL
jgi:alkylation response protein AidB-like acyl-CoA dehydrogenase